MGFQDIVALLSHAHGQPIDVVLSGLILRVDTSRATKRARPKFLARIIIAVCNAARSNVEHPDVVPYVLRGAEDGTLLLFVGGMSAQVSVVGYTDDVTPRIVVPLTDSMSAPVRKIVLVP